MRDNGHAFIYQILGWVQDGAEAERWGVCCRELKHWGQSIPTPNWSISDNLICICRTPSETGDTAVNKAKTPALSWHSSPGERLYESNESCKAWCKVTNAAGNTVGILSMAALGDFLEEGALNQPGRIVGSSQADYFPEKCHGLSPSLIQTFTIMSPPHWDLPSLPIYRRTTRFFLL